MKGLLSGKFIKDLGVEGRSLVILGLALVFLTLSIFGGFIPKMEEALQNREKASELEARLAIYEALAKEQDYFKKASAQMAKLQALEERLPKNLEQASLMEELHAAAEDCGVKLTALRGVGQGLAKKQDILLQLEGKADYASVLKFLQRVENKGSLKILQEFSAKGNEDDGSLEIFTMVRVGKIAG